MKAMKKPSNAKMAAARIRVMKTMPKKGMMMKEKDMMMSKKDMKGC